MMKNLLAITLFAILSSGFVAATTDYEKDEQYIFVADAVQDALEAVNHIVCFVSSMKPEEFVNDGNYLAIVSDNDCDNGGIKYFNIVNVTRASEDEPVNINTWISPEVADIDIDQGSLFYSQIKQTAGVSSEAPNGDFEMLWSPFVAEDEALDNRFKGLGYLKANKDNLIFTYDYYDDDRWLDLEKTFVTYRDNGDIVGGFSEIQESYGKEGESDYLLFYSFFINDADSSYCKKLVAVDKFTFDAKDIKTMNSWQKFYSRITTEPIPEFDKKGFITDEQCYSTIIEDSFLDVYDYGVYNPDGSRLIAESSNFSLVGQVTNEKSKVIDVKVYVHQLDIFVSPKYMQYLHLVNDTTEFRKLNLYGQSSEEIYYLKPKDIDIELVEPRYLEEDGTANNRVLFFSNRLIGLAEMAAMDDKLWYCVENCITSDALGETMSQINNVLENKGDAEVYDFSQVTVARPYKEYSNIVEKSELVTYSISEAGLRDSDGKFITLSPELRGKFLAVAQEDMGSMAFLEGQIDKYFIHEPLLISADDLEKLKCDDEVGKYCPDQFKAADFDSYYYVQLNFSPKFALYDSLGKPAHLGPKTLHYDVPESEGTDAGKIKVTYHKHGDLRGIPQKKRYVSNTESTYTVVDKIVIPDGSELTDEQGNKFKVKVLDAAQYLGERNEYKGRYNHSLDVDSIRLLRPNLQGYNPAEQPAKKDIINEGKPSVIGGKILYDPTPNAR